MTGKGRAFLILFVVFLLPISIYIILRITTEQHFQKLEIIGSRTVQVQDGSVRTINTVFDAFEGLNFTTQTGEPFSVDSLKGHIFIADCFFSRCTGICPKLSSGLSFLHDYTGEAGGPEVRFLSITVDPGTDSVPTLRAYADKYGADDDRWYFITGEEKDLYELAHYGFMFKAMKGEGGELGFIHDNLIMLVDKEGRIRKGDHFYDGTNREDLKLLKEELRVLMLEYAIDESK